MAFDAATPELLAKNAKSSFLAVQPLVGPGAPKRKLRRRPHGRLL
jgi:hypothetical protein